MPRFAYTKYKTQKAKFKAAVLDLHSKLKKIAGEYYKRFC